MEKLFLVGPKRLAAKVLLELQHAGVVQIDPLASDEMSQYLLAPEEEARLKKWEAAAISADHASRLLGLELDKSVAAFQGGLEAAEAAASSYEQQAAVLVEKRERLRDELQLVEQYQAVVEYLANAVQSLDESPRLSVLPFLVEREEDLAAAKQQLAKALDDRFLLAEGAVGKVTAAVIIVLGRDAEEARGILCHEGLCELPRLKEYAGVDMKAMAAGLTARAGAVPAEMAAVEEDLRQLIQDAGQALAGLWKRASDESSRLQALKEMASGRYGFALFGWVPVSLRNQVVEAMSRFGDQVLYAFEPAEAHHEPERIPVMLENPGWVRPFESLISFLNTPRYDSWDPTWITATLFPLWFGMIVGDIGYGLVFMGIAWYLSTFVKSQQVLRVDFFKMRMSPGAVAQLVGVMKPMIIWTILWGCVYGEFFGNLLQRLGVFGTAQAPGVLPTLIPRTETAATATTLILVSIGFGTLQVLHGFFLKAQLTRQQGEKKHFWEAVGYFGGVTAMILFGYAFMTGAYPLWLVIPMILGGLFFVIGMFGAKMPLMIAELPTQGGHILSYIRIYAVGLASAILANLATDIGFALYRMWGLPGIVIGVLIGAVLGILIHTILIILLTVSHVLQPIRLIWVEFFTKFDFYSLNGRPYRPFKLTGGPS